MKEEEDSQTGIMKTESAMGEAKERDGPRKRGRSTELFQNLMAVKRTKKSTQ